MLCAAREIAEYVGKGLLPGKFRLLSIEVFFDAEHIGGEVHQLAHIFGSPASANETCAVVAQSVVFQPWHFFSFGCGVTIDYSLVAFIGYLFADVVFVIGNENALALAAVFGV